MLKYHKTSEEISRLSPGQYEVTQRNGTERAFKNAYWDNKQPGLYVDVVSDEPLFTWLDKFDSVCDWSSFTKPIEDENVIEKDDTSHLGHVFPDGPPEAGRSPLLYQFGCSTIYSCRPARERGILQLP
jgi:peptide-methionine (R)-S-oxide reductase